MASLDKRDLSSALTGKLGAEEIAKRDHAWFVLRINGVAYAATKLSHGSEKQIGQPILGRIARQLGLTTAQLLAVVGCSIESGTYYSLLARQGKRTEIIGL